MSDARLAGAFAPPTVSRGKPRSPRNGKSGMTADAAAGVIRTARRAQALSLSRRRPSQEKESESEHTGVHPNRIMGGLHSWGKVQLVSNPRSCLSIHPQDIQT